MIDPITTKVVLIAVLSFAKSNMVSSVDTGYQTSVMQTFSTLSECNTAGLELLNTYKKGNIITGRAPDGGSIRCISMDKDGKMVGRPFAVFQSAHNY